MDENHRTVGGSPMANIKTMISAPDHAAAASP